MATRKEILRNSRSLQDWYRCKRSNVVSTQWGRTKTSRKMARCQGNSATCWIFRPKCNFYRNFRKFSQKIEEIPGWNKHIFRLKKAIFNTRLINVPMQRVIVMLNLSGMINLIIHGNWIKLLVLFGLEEAWKLNQMMECGITVDIIDIIRKKR